MELIYFAWVNENEAFNPTVHDRMDEWVFDFKYEQTEGDFAGVAITIKNPRIGLLNPSRKVWAYLSFDDNGSITPIIKGRLVGVPSNIFDTLVTLEFTARPSNYVIQKAALAHTMRVAPYFDPIFVAPTSWLDPDVVLEAYSMLWHIHPVTHVMTASDVLIGEDGVEEVTESQHFYDNMQLTLNTTPLRSVSMVATIPWTQVAEGNLDLTPKLFKMFPNHIVSSFTMSGLISNWPKQGSSFGSGWQVFSGSLTDVSFGMPKAIIPDIFSWQGTVPDLPQGSIVFPLHVTGEYHWGETAGFNLQFELVVAQIGYARPELTVTYTANRDMAQIITFTLETDQQPIVTLPGTDESLVISVAANSVSDPTMIGPIPLPKPASRSFAHSARGLLAIEHLLLLARATLILRSRAVEISIQCDFRTARRCISLRKGMLLHDHRLPGGQAVGKIIKTELSLSGDNGEPTGVITIGSCVGKGGAYTIAPGTPSYVDEGYMDNTQQYDNQIKLTDTADIAWTVPMPTPFDDGLDFINGLTTDNAILQAFVTDSAPDQVAPIMAASAKELTDQAAISAVLQTIPTQFTVQMKPMEGGPFQQEVVVSVSKLIVPKQIDLEAPSNA